MRASAVMFTGPRRVELVEIEQPADDLGATEALIRTKLTLLSGGTEGAWFQGQSIPGRPPMQYPFRTGYANIGEVVAMGSAVKTVALGDVVYTMGNHASIIRVDAAARVCAKVPAGLPLEQAVFARLLTVPMASVRTAGARPGDRAAVTGLGLVGNLGAQLLQACGMPVTAADPIVPAESSHGSAASRTSSTRLYPARSSPSTGWCWSAAARRRARSARSRWPSWAAKCRWSALRGWPTRRWDRARSSSPCTPSTSHCGAAGNGNCRFRTFATPRRACTNRDRSATTPSGRSS